MKEISLFIENINVGDRGYKWDGMDCGVFFK